MAITVLGYAKSGQTHVSRSGSPAADGVNVALEVIEIEPELRLVPTRGRSRGREAYEGAWREERRAGERAL